MNSLDDEHPMMQCRRIHLLAPQFQLTTCDLYFLTASCPSWPLTVYYLSSNVFRTGRRLYEATIENGWQNEFSEGAQPPPPRTTRFLVSALHTSTRKKMKCILYYIRSDMNRDVWNSDYAHRNAITSESCGNDLKWAKRFWDISLKRDVCWSQLRSKGG